jgi:hypothetical protein
MTKTSKKKNAKATTPQVIVRGHKIFSPDFTCRGYQFAENTEYTHPGKPIPCSNGFHFCRKPSHLFSYYSFDPKNIVCEIEAFDEVADHEDGTKSCTCHIRIGRRLSWEEVLQVANEGSGNTGHSNTGNRNTGYRNTGNRNTGNRNTGNRNTGDWNTGDWNTGDWNTGNSNTGNRNTGDWNTGDWNTGNRNTGYRNTGNRNTGNRNTGDWNTGDWNTGDWNTGNRNTGYSNTGNRNTGAFCTTDAPFPMFNKPSDWTEKDFLESRAYYLMYNDVNTKMWVHANAMTDEDKAANKGWKAADGYVKDIPFKEAFQNAWHNWSNENRQSFKDLPNFDVDVFFEITGVRL